MDTPQSLNKWLSYQAQPPRVLKTVTCPLLKKWVTTKLEHYLQNPVRSRYVGSTQTGGTQQKPSGLHSTKTGKNLEALISLVRESEVTTTQDLLSWIQNHPHKKPEFMHRLYSPGQFTQLMNKALEWVASEKEKSLIWSQEIYTVNKANHPKGAQWMSLNKSTECLDMWFKWQNINAKTFIQSVEEIMEKKINKVNTLLLLGPSNGGKRLIARSLCDAFKSVGVCLQGTNYSFFLENCISTRVIHHDECIIVPQVMEMYKRLVEGADTPVKRKNKVSQMMKRTPYIVTANSLPWLSLPPVDQEAFKNRCIIYNVRTCPGLRKYSQDIHPGAWAFEHHF